MVDTIEFAATTTAAATTLAGQVTDAAISQFGAVDYAVVGFLLMVSAAIGIYFGYFDGTEQTTEEYLLGGRRLRPIPVAISLVASQLSAYSFISVPSEIYSFGSNYTIVVLPAVVCMTFAINYGILPVFYENNIDNCYGYLEMRFGKETKNLLTFLFFLGVLLLMPIGSFLPAFAFAQISGLNLHMINAIVSLVCIFYTMLGGVKAVVWTDVMQAFVMVFTVVVVPTLAIVRIGGFGETWASASEGGRLEIPPFVFDMATRQTVWNMFSGIFLMWLSHVAFSQSCVQRLASLPSLKHAQLTMYIFMVGVIVIKLAVGTMGVVMYSYYKDCDPVAAGILTKADQLAPYFVNEIVGHLSGMPGLFISCVLSASLSTTSAYLNCVSGLLYKDCVCKIPGYRHTEPRANVIMKAIIVVTGLYCIGMGFLVERSTSLFQLQQTFTGMIVGAIGGVFGMALFYPWASQKATLWGAVISMVLMAWLIVGSMIYPNDYTPLPTSTDGCNVTESVTLNQLILSSTTSSIPPTTPLPSIGQDDEPFSIFSMSFQWYPLIGHLIVWIVAIPLSHTLFPLAQPVDAQLVSPLLRWLAPSAMTTKPRHVEMQLIGGGGGGGDRKVLSSVVTESKYAVR